MEIILISGLARAGKDTCGNFIQDYFNSLHIVAGIHHFAEKVKACALDYFNWDRNKTEKGRKLLQDIGMFGREYNQDLWVDDILDKVSRHVNAKYVIIPDWRFHNEYMQCQKQYKTWKIRVENPRLDLTNPCYQNASEMGLPPYNLDPNYYDFVIMNDGSLEELEKKCVEIAQKIVNFDENR
jgi:hypothetical protein